ncbi:MAG TPA: tetratricopeptide repeat protein, partial [Vicinamibacteria bacterium]|nr:tetratricopeptide repeat protein [Vicinamibacteria bacterium]
GRTRDAIAALQAVLERDPERASAHLALARLYAIGGNRAEMERHAARAAGAEPGKAFEMLAEATFAARRMDDADAFARRAVAADPERVIAHYVLGLVAASRGKCEEALGDYGRADQARQRQQGLVVPGLQARIGECLARLGRETEAERAFQAEIAAQPSSVDGRMGLAILYRSQGRDEAAREALAGIVTANLQAGANEYWTVVRSLAGLGDAPAARVWAARARERFPNDKRFR